MRLLALESETDATGDIRGWLRVGPTTCTPSGGARLAPVAMLVDALGGLRSLSAAAPGWAFTADMSIHLLPVGPTTRLQADAHVRRRGRRTLVLEVDLTADGIPAGLATLSFTIVARPEHLVDVQIDTSPGRRMMSVLDPDEPPAGPYLEELGLVVERPGHISVELRPEVSNTVGALHGGVHSALVDEAARTLGVEVLGPRAETTDVHLAFLELGRAGPLLARATLVGGPAPAGDRATVEVEVRDADARLCSYATAEVTVP